MPPAPKRRKANAEQAVVEVFGKRLMPADALRIRGQHNASNALAALALARAIDLPMAKLLHGPDPYTPLTLPPHTLLPTSAISVSFTHKTLPTNSLVETAVGRRA